MSGDAASGTALLLTLSGWTERSWIQPTAAGRRHEVTYAAVQRLADIAADAEGQPRRPVPRLDARESQAALAGSPREERRTGIGTGLVDQLAVMIGDIAAFGDATAQRAAGEVLAGLRRQLGLPAR